MDKIDQYIETINRNVLSKTSYDRLQADYATEEKAYAKGVLNALHMAAVEVYGSDCLEDGGELEYVLLPGIIQSKANGNLCIGLLEIDLLSSGEHCGTDFLTRFGCVNQSDSEMPGKVKRFLSNTYGAYDYAYTLQLENDIHIDPSRFSPEIREMLDTFKDYDFVPVESKYVIGNVNEPEEDMER